jgi:hypothetical protein
MTRRKLLPVALTSLVVLLYGLLTPGAGHAAKVGWPGRTICAKGTVAAGTPIPGILERIPFDINLVPCASVDPATLPEARWGVATYTAWEATIASYELQPFALEGPTVGQTFGIFTLDLPRTQAVCLITGLNSRIACLRVTRDQATGAFGFQSLAAGDPLVARPVVFRDETGNPECGACP